MLSTQQAELGCLDAARHGTKAKEKGQVGSDLAFSAKVSPTENCMPNLFGVTGRASSGGHCLLVLSTSPQTQSRDQ